MGAQQLPRQSAGQNGGDTIACAYARARHDIRPWSDEIGQRCLLIDMLGEALSSQIRQS